MGDNAPIRHLELPMETCSDRNELHIFKSLAKRFLWKLQTFQAIVKVIGSYSQTSAKTLLLNEMHILLNMKKSN